MEYCEHKNWEVQLDNQIGTGTCHDCHSEVLLSTLFNNLRRRMEQSIEKMQRKKNPEASVSHKLGVILGCDKLSYAVLLGLMQTIHTHSTKEDWEKLIRVLAAKMDK